MSIAGVQQAVRRLVLLLFLAGSLDETMAVKDHDVVLVPRGHHPSGAPYGFEMYYLNVMAGPRPNWRSVPAPEVEWIMERDS